MRRAICCVISSVLASLFLSLPVHSEMASPAHLLAEKFAQEPDKPAVAPPAALAITKPAAAKPAAAKPTFKRAPAPGPDYEQEMLNAARAEADARRVAQQAPSPQPAVTAAPAIAKPAATAPAANVQAAVKPSAVVAAPPPVAATTTGAPAHVSVLLVLDPQLNATDQAASQPAPVLCIGDDCYVSGGADGAAHPRTRADATNAKDASGDCRGKTHCIFRDVTLKPGAELQILDTTFGKAGASKSVEVLPDKSCSVVEGELDCELTLSGAGYRVWLVPEAIAASTTPLILEGALATDLVEENVSRTDDR